MEYTKESWKSDEPDNMSIGELLEYLQQLPKDWHHLPVQITYLDQVVNINPPRLSFTDGQRYFSMAVMQARRIFSGVVLEIDANPPRE